MVPPQHKGDTMNTKQVTQETLDFLNTHATRCGLNAEWAVDAWCLGRGANREANLYLTDDENGCVSLVFRGAGESDSSVTLLTWDYATFDALISSRDAGILKWFPRAVAVPIPAVSETLCSTIETLSDLLEEAHADEVNNDHGGDDPAECSYCNAIKTAREIIGTDSPAV
jgi:hypothetical protein